MTVSELSNLAKLHLPRSASRGGGDDDGESNGGFGI